VSPPSITIRAATPDDEPFLWDMGWEATAVDEGMRALGRDLAFSRPEVRKYLAGWGRPGDAGVVAVNHAGNRLGAAWYRLFPADDPGYGFVAADVPELSIGVIVAARGQGVGGALLDALLVLARGKGWRALSLSVDRQNPARRLYERKGFHDAGVSLPADSSVTLIAML
jgi:GNAT superfamily N-acetyltransferase